MTGCLNDVPIFSLYKTNDRNTPTNSFPGISSCFIGFDFDSETSLIVKRVHQVTEGQAGTVHLVAALCLLRGRRAGRTPPLKMPLHGNCNPKDVQTQV